MGLADRTVRLVLAIAFAAMYFTHLVNGIWGIVVLALSINFLLTAWVRFCPLYLPFNINTNKKKNHGTTSN